MKKLGRTLVRLASATALSLILSHLPPLVSRAYAQHGDQMAEVMKKFAETNFNIDMNTAAAIIVASKKNQIVSEGDLTQMIRIWNTWKDQQGVLPPEQKKKFNGLFFHPQHGIVNFVSEEQKKKLIREGILQGTTTEQIPVPIIRGDVVRRPQISFFPEGISIKKNVVIGTPDVSLGSSIRGRMEDEKEPAFSSQLGDAIRTEAINGAGSAEAIAAGTAIANALRNLPGVKDDPDIILGQNVLDLLEKGRISQALNKPTLVENLSKIAEQIRFETPIFALSLSGESPRFKPFEATSRFYLSGVAAVDILVNKQWKGVLEEGENGLEIVLKPSGETNSNVVMRGGARGTIELPPGKGMEIYADLSLLGNVGIPEFPPLGAGLKIGFTDVSGRFIVFGSVPVYTAVSFDMEWHKEKPFFAKHRGAVAAGLFNVGEWTFMPVVDWSVLLSGNKPIPQPAWTISPGFKFTRGDHSVGARFLGGKDTHGGGVVYTYDNLTLGFDATRQSTKTDLRRLSDLEQWFFGGTVRVDFGARE